MDRERRRTGADAHTDANSNADTNCHAHSHTYRNAAAYSDAQESSHTETAPNCLSASIGLRRSSSNTGVLAKIPP